MKSYKNLKEEVWDTNRCSGCGACVAVCPVNNLYFVEESPVKFECDECSCILIPTDITTEHPISAEFCKTVVYDVPCGSCYDACPRIKKSSVPKKDGLGNILKAVKAKSLIEIKNAQNGGVVTAILANAFEEGLIDGAIVMIDDKFTLEPTSYLSLSKEDVIKAAGSKYLWKGPILKSLKTAVMEKKLKKLAVVGTPCVINAITQIMASADNDLLKPFKNAIRLKIAIFCFETYDYNKMIKKLKSEGIEPWEIRKMDIESGKLKIKLINGDVVEYKLKDLEDLMRSGCKVCGDFTGLTSDISVGNVGSEEGYSTVLIRNKWGEGFFKRAVYNGYLTYDEDVDLEAVKKLSELKKSRVKNKNKN
ncbi:Coenzyme F420-dependent oxidoreductase [Methanocaldococcus lauensis]|uniref:Coenzyme F420-dependent oxidoreductase n=1 Tax=Methanocaldococcus lauensis TaxID=2546128 RepID=A0A8D6SUN1_9EURY|nr:Coenzyme F420 hydrogenase/dehydrogenase, beta subunit C-terminal domain [Methanocaldococcus lauensis]CAB3288637.1 Coenzyme F420-dependent oxidoreductase [Methanocaldococcus lauensis]